MVTMTQVAMERLLKLGRILPVLKEIQVQTLLFPLAMARLLVRVKVA